MKLVKPSWVHHDEKPIFSVDVHQECQKFATGGQGNDSGLVVIWNLLPVLSEKAELDESIPKILCQMDTHLACVNCVRWSQNGQMLASGSDDRSVMIWRQVQGSSGIFGTGGMKKNAETWRCIAQLRGHSGDVLDVAWSPQDRWLASCSIDNTIIVWDVQAFPAMVAMLKGHSGLVKGITWDPVGKYLASQSDDRTVKIWKTSDWTCKSTISEPFEECGGTTHILRLSWSSDGQYLVSAHAMNSGGPTAQIIERDDWKCEKDFVGHRKAVTCVRFHNSVLKGKMPNTNKQTQYCCLAVGSRDRSLSVWMTALQRPLVVIHELFEDSILDLSWGQAKCVLMACSGDGTVACLQFSETDLGVPLSPEEKNSLYQRIYGKSFILENGNGDAVDMLIENVELLNSTPEKIKPPSLPVIDVNTNHLNSISSSEAFPKVVSNGVSPTPVQAAANFTGSTIDNIQHSTMNQQIEIRTADGKRRVKPIFIPTNPIHSSQVAPTLNSVSTTSELPTEPMVTEQVAQSKPSEQEVSQTQTGVVITEAEQIRLDSRLMKTVSAPLQISKDTLKTFPNTTSTTAAKPAPVIPGTAHQSTTSGQKLNSQSLGTAEYEKVALDYRVRVENGKVHTQSGALTRVSTYRVSSSERLWEIFVGSPIVNFNFCTKYIILCCLDGTLRFLSMKTSCPIFPIITLTTAAIQCGFSPNCKLVGVITDCGILRIWEIEKERISLATTCSEFLAKSGAVLQFNITDSGMPMVLLANGNSYSYSKDMQSWLVMNSGDIITRHGLQTTLPKNFKINYQTYPLTSTQALTHNFSPSSDGLDMNANMWQSSAKISFIEHQIKLCECIKSPEELKHWYSMLAYQLAVSGTEQRLRTLLNDLLGLPTDSNASPSSTTSSSKRTDYILSIPKHTILENVLNVLKTHMKWQRIYMEYMGLYETWKQNHNKSHSRKSIEKSAKQELLNRMMDTT